MPNTAFEKALRFGEEGEADLHRYLVEKGFIADPRWVYSHNEAPRLYGAGESWVAPDMRVDRPGMSLFAESKRKTTWSEPLYRTDEYAGEDETGCNLHHFYAYCKTHDATGIPVALFFLHDQPQRYGESGVWFGWAHELRGVKRVWNGRSRNGDRRESPIAFFPKSSLQRVNDWFDVLGGAK